MGTKNVRTACKLWLYYSLWIEPKDIGCNGTRAIITQPYQQLNTSSKKNKKKHVDFAKRQESNDLLDCIYSFPFAL
jgi:hypothetical protein